MDPLPLTDNVAAQIEHLAHPNATGEILEAGPNLTLEPYQLILFANKFKDPDPADSEVQAEQRAKRPDFWGRLNPGDGSPRGGDFGLAHPEPQSAPLVGGRDHLSAAGQAD